MQPLAGWVGEGVGVGVGLVDGLGVWAGGFGVAAGADFGVAGPFPPAKDRTAMENAARGAFERLGDGRFELAGFSFRNEAGGFVPVSRFVEENGFGLMQWMNVPRPWSIVLAILTPDSPLEVTTNDVTFAYAIASNHRRRLAAAIVPTPYAAAKDSA